MRENLYPTYEFLTDHLWRLSEDTSIPTGTAVRLLEDGSIGNVSSPDYVNWRISDGILEFLKNDGSISVRFDQFNRESEIIRLYGLKTNEHAGIVTRLEQRVWGSDEEEFAPQTKLRMKSQIEHLGWTIGSHTYGLPTVYANSPEKLHIGKYCSMGENVTITLAVHRPDFVSTFPFATFRKHWPGTSLNKLDHTSKGDVVIGSDVWIGHGALISSGVKIGDGAVVGAQSVVTHDVPPYAIVAGVPAKIIRFRFDPETITALLELRWWDFADEDVEYLADYILSSDISSFLEKAKTFKKHK